MVNLPTGRQVVKGLIETVLLRTKVKEHKLFYMKFLVATILTAVLAFIAGLLSFSPWWGFAIASLLVAVLVHQKAGKAFLAGYTGVFLLWAGLAWWIDMKNNGVLSAKIATVLPLGGNTVYLILVTALIGGLVAGLAAVTGSYLRATKPGR